MDSCRACRQFARNKTGFFKILPEKAFAVASNQQYDEFHQKLTSIFYIETGGIRK